jgi:hypothetical protein
MVDHRTSARPGEGHCAHCHKRGYELGLRDGARRERRRIRRAMTPKPDPIFLSPPVAWRPDETDAQHAARVAAYNAQAAAHMALFEADLAAWNQLDALTRGPGRRPKDDSDRRRQFLDHRDLLWTAFSHLRQAAPRGARPPSHSACIAWLIEQGHPVTFETSRKILSAPQPTWTDLSRQWRAQLEEGA